MVTSSPHMAVPKAVAETFVAALANSSLLANDISATLLSNTMLRESPDASDAAAIRYMVFRTDLTIAVREALALHPRTEHLSVSGKTTPPVRVELRGTAGRFIQGGAFSVGSHPLCDVQVCGDTTVVPLQCVVVPLLSGILVADAWSPGGSRMTWWRAGGKAAAPELGCSQRQCIMLPHGERIVFRLGQHTVMALGPPSSCRANEAEAAMLPWAASDSLGMRLLHAARPSRADATPRSLVVGNAEAVRGLADASSALYKLCSEASTTFEESSLSSSSCSALCSGRGLGTPSLRSRSRSCRRLLSAL